MRKMFMGFGEKVETEIKNDISSRLEKGQRFSLSVDEWTSNANRKYMAIEMHTSDNVRINLGMRRVDKELPATKAADMIVKVLAEYGLDIKRHIVCFISDGASVMKATGRILDIYHQVCIDHGIHLAVQEIYKQREVENGEEESTDEDSDCEEDDEENGDVFNIVENGEIPALSGGFGPIVKTVRNVAKFFKRSPPKKEYLDDERRKAEKSVLSMIVDTPTRWNSTFFMLERYLELQIEADIVLRKYRKEEWCLSEHDLREIRLLTESLCYFEKLSRALCEREMSITKADKLCEFYLGKMQDLSLQNPIMRGLYESLYERLTERRCEDLIGLARYLESGKNYKEIAKSSILSYPKREKLNEIAAKLYDRLFGDNLANDQLNNDQSQAQPEQNKSEEDELKELLSKDEMDYGKKKISTLTLITAEMALFEKDPKNEQPMLKKLKEALKSCLPTSVEPERCFSAAAVFVNKFRTCLKDDIINYLILVRAFLQRIEKG